MPPIALLAIGIALIILGTYEERKAQKAIEEIRFYTEDLRIFSQHNTSNIKK